MYNRKKLDDQDNSKIENIAKLVPNGKKKWVRYDEGAVLYSMGINSFRQLVKRRESYISREPYCSCKYGKSR